MENQLLQWGIANAAPGALPAVHEDIKAGKRPDLNPEMLKAIMGQSEAEKMMDQMKVITTWDKKRFLGTRTPEDGQHLIVDKEDAIVAWENLEMLVEDINNANDLKNMGLWPPIVEHLQDPDQDIVLHACWVSGTAVQNNQDAQRVFLDHNPLPALIAILNSRQHNKATKNKAMYCLSSTLKHFQPAVDQFAELDGWPVLSTALNDSSVTLRSKTAFLLGQLIMQSSSLSSLVPSLRDSGIINTLITSLSPSIAIPSGPNGDEAIDPDYLEKALRDIYLLAVDCGKDGLTTEEKAQMLQIANELSDDSAWTVDAAGMTESEWNKFILSLQ